MSARLLLPTQRHTLADARPYKGLAWETAGCPAQHAFSDENIGLSSRIAGFAIVGVWQPNLDQRPMQIEQQRIEVYGGETRLRAKQAAEFLGVGVPTLQTWRSLGIGPPWSRIGRKLIVYRLEDLKTFAEASNTAAA